MKRDYEMIFFKLTMTFVIYPLMVALVLVTFAAMCAGVYYGCDWLIYHRNDPSPETFELRKDEWTCANHKTYTTTTMVMSGKVMVPITTTHVDCINWLAK